MGTIEAEPLKLAARAITATDDDMVLSHKQHACRLPYRVPAALVRCRSEPDVAEALASVIARNLPFSIRSGGHCFADLSTAGDAVIDLAEMDHVSIEQDIVRVGPGALAGELVRTLAARGLTIPTGGCPLVAMGGLALAGGFGFLGRKHGLVTDRLAWARVLLADGTIVTADETRHPDLFWALRGAGAGGFGIVVELGLRHVPALPAIACAATYPIEAAADLIASWQHWAPDAPGEVSIELSLVCPDDPAEPCHIRLYGLLFGQDRGELLVGLVQALGPLASSLDIADMDPASAALHAAGAIGIDGEPAWLPSRPFRRVGFQATRSGFFEQALPAQAIAALVKRSEQDRTVEGREIEFVPWRGAYSLDRPGASFGHRSARFLIRHTGVAGSRSTREEQDRITRWADESASIVRPHGNGRVYQGYAEAARPDWSSAYYGASYERLLRIKAAYDSHNRFSGPQTIVQRRAGRGS